MINASTSSSSRTRQYRRQMKKTKVFSGFTNQLKEVLGRLWGRGGRRWCQNEEAALGQPTPCPRLWPPPAHLGFSKGSGSFRPFPTGRFSASSTVSSSNSASTFPWKREEQRLSS